MAGYREQFVKSLSFLGAALPTPWLIRLSGQRLIVPVYHLIADEAPSHVQHLYPIKNVQDFIRDLDFLLKHYEPIDFFTLKELARSGQAPAKNAFILTFDDGLREFHEVIAPILREKGIPAICFLNSDFVDNRGLFYRYKASLLLDAFAKDAALGRQDGVVDWLQRHAQGSSNRLRDTLLSVSYQNRAVLDELAGLIHCDFNQYLREQRPYLDSSQIAALKAQGFYFGAHSCDHPEYRFLSLNEQLRQTRDSVAAVCRQFDLPYRAFAFPFTDYQVSDVFFSKVLEEEQIVEVSFGCAGLKQEAFPGHLQRIPLEMASLGAKAIINTEYLYFLIKAPLGKNVIERG